MADAPMAASRTGAGARRGRLLLALGVAMLVTMADEQEHHASTQSKPAATRDRATARDVVRVQADAPSPAAVPVGNGLASPL